MFSIIIVDFSTSKYTINLLQSLGNDGCAEIIVVDNNINPELGKIISKKHPFVKYFHSGENIGFANACNLGFSHTKGEWIALLNSDTLVNIDKLKKLVNIAQQNKYKVVVPKLVGLNKKFQNNVGFFDYFLKNPINWLFARPRFIDTSKITNLLPVDLSTGAALLVHRSVIQHSKIFDSNYFMYFEDIDFSYSLYKQKIKILFVPEVVVTHLGGTSANQDTFQKNCNYLTSLQIYLKKNRGPLINMINNFFHFFK